MIAFAALMVSGGVSELAVVERAIGSAQAPGLLRVNCFGSDLSTSDFEVKSLVESACSQVAKFPVPALDVYNLNYYVPAGVLQFTVENTCEQNLAKVNADGCKLEFNSIAYGCDDNGLFYNGSSSYGCVNFKIQLFNNTEISPRGDIPTDPEPRLLCEFPQPDNATVSSSDLIDNVADGCKDLATNAYSIPPLKTYKWWKTEDDGTIALFKIHNLSGTSTLNETEAGCLSAFNFVISECTQSENFLHGYHYQGDVKTEIQALPVGTDPITA